MGQVKDYRDGFKDWLSSNWRPVASPSSTVGRYIAPENEEVWTKIHDERGERNIAKLTRKGNLWFVLDGSMYVYYTPTHWRR